MTESKLYEFIAFALNMNRTDVYASGIRMNGNNVAEARGIAADYATGRRIEWYFDGFTVINTNSGETFATEQPETETAEADETEINEQERDIMHEADMEAIEGGYAAAKKYEAAGHRLKEILNDPTQHRYLDRAQEQYITAARRYDAWCDLQDALKEIDRHGYCYLLALIIIKYGKAEQIVRFIMRKAKAICEDEHITLYNNPRIAPQTITMWAINQYGGLLTQADMDSAIAWRKQCLTIRPKKGV